jgi:hypothetical protein
LKGFFLCSIGTLNQLRKKPIPHTADQMYNQSMKRGANMKVKVLLATGAVAITLAAPAVAQFIPSKASISHLYGGKVYSPYAQRSFPSRPLWGDTHLHTSLSVDAGLFGGKLGLEDAYRFARGEEVISATGQMAWE